MVKPNYKGDLLKPIVEERQSLMSTLGEELIKQHHVHAEMFRKLELLLDHYQIDRGPDQWAVLALCLAQDHVPGFQRIKPSGRPRTSSDALGLIPAYATLCIERLQQEVAPKKMKIIEATKILSERSPWKEARKTPEVIRALYYKGKKDARAVAMLRDAIACNEAFFTSGTSGTTPSEDLVIQMILEPVS